MGLHVLILDGNVKRVLAYYLAQDGCPGEPKVARTLWEAAERFIPHARVNHYTQTMTGLGATLCTCSKPSCLFYPLVSDCRAHLLGRKADYPQSKPYKVLPQKRALMPTLANRDGAILLYRRPSNGLWGGPRSLPELDDLDGSGPLAACHSLAPSKRRKLSGLTHTSGHFQLTIKPWLVAVEGAPRVVAEGDWLWYNLTAPSRLGLAAPVKKLFKRAEWKLGRGAAV